MTCFPDIIVYAIKHDGADLKEAARRIGISEKYLRQIIEGYQPLSVNVALSLEREFGLSSEGLLCIAAQHHKYRLKDMLISRRKARSFYSLR